MKHKLLNLSTYDKTILEQLLNQNLQSDSWIWAKTTYPYYIEIKNEDKQLVFKNLISADKRDNSLSRLHLLQTFGSHLNYDDVNFDLNTVESIVALRSLVHCDSIDVQIAEVFAKIKYMKNETMKDQFYDM